MPALPSKQTVFLALALVSLMVVQGVGIWSERGAAAAQQQRRHTIESLLSLRAIRETTRLNEARFREYLISGEEPAADQVGIGLADSRNRRAHARELMGGDTNQVRRLDRLDAVLARVSGTFVRLIDARRAEGGEAAAKLAAAAGLRRLAEEAEFVLNELEAEEYRLLGERDARAQHFAGVVSITTKAGIGLTLLFSLLAWRALHQRERARQAADAQKLEAVAQFRGLMENSPDAVWINQDGRVAFANPAFARLLGQSVPAEVIGRSPFEFVRPDFHEHTRESARSLAAGQVVAPKELVYVRADGTQIPVEVSVVPATFNGRPSVQVIARDLTERKRAEQALRASEARYRTLFDSIDEGFCIIELVFDEAGRPVDYRFLEINPSFEKQTGLRDAAGRSMRELAPGHEEHWFETYGRIAVTGEPARFQNRAEQLHRWYDVFAFRFGEPKLRQVAILFSDITARKEAEAALQASEGNLAVTLESIGDGVLATDAAGRVTRLNAVAETLTGWTQAEAVGRPVGEIFHILNETTRQPALLPVADTLAKGTTHGLANHTVLVARDGTERPIADSCAPIRSRADGVTGAVLVFRDVTEQRRTEQALAKSAAEIQDLYHNSPCGHHSVDKDGFFVAINDTELAWFGRTREELIGKVKHRELVTPDTQAAYDRGFDVFKATGRVRDLEFKIARPDGVVMDMLLNATSVRDAEGRVLYSRSTMFDISDRRRAETALRESEESLAVTLHSIGDGVLATDAEGRVTRLNQVAEKLTGWTQAEAAGRPVGEIFQILNETTRQPALLPVADTLAKGTTHGLANHTVLVARDGTERPIADSCAPIRNRAGAVVGAVLVFRDVTQERNAELALRASRCELEAALQATRRIMDHSLDVICTIDEQGRFVSVSAASERVWGYRPDELVGRPYMDFVCAADRPKTAQAAADIMTGQPVTEFENRYQRKDGTLVPVTWSAAWSPSDQTMFCVAHDSTNRKRLETALGHERYLLRELMDHATQSIYFKDRASRFIRINHCLATRFGLRDAAEATGRTDFDFFAPEHARKAQADEQQVMLTGQPVTSEEQETWPDGRVTWALTTKLPLHDEDGNIAGTFGLSLDITARKQVEQIHLQFRALFESLPGLYLVLKPDFTIVAVSDAYLRATMTKREAILGRGIFDVFPDNPQDPAATGTNKLRISLDRVRQHAAADTMAIQRYDVRRPDGTFEQRFWSPVNAPVFGADQRIEYIIHRVEDVTAFMRQRQQPSAEDTVMLSRMEQLEAEIYRSAQAVQAARDQLELRVKERTAELAATNQELLGEIAAREQSQLALRAAETKFRTLVEQSLVGIYVIQDGRFIYVNPRMEEIFGFTAEELTTRPVMEFIVEADRPLAQGNLRRRLEGEVPSIRYQLRMTRRDGTIVQVEVHGARNEFNGRPAILGTLLDITEQKLAEQRLAGERQLLRTLIDNLPSHIYVKDAAGRYLISNESHTRLLGAASEAELLGKTVADFFPPEIARAFVATDEVLLQGGQAVIEREERYEARGGHGWHSATKVALRDPQGRIIGLVGIRHDISERKRAEEELRFYTASLERSNRELQDFASVASHDLQEPLRKIQAFSDRLQARSGAALDEAGRDYLGRMQNAAARMQTLVNDLLTFSRVTTRAQPFAATDLAAVTREVLSDLETRLEQTRGRVEVADLPVIQADAMQMRQLLQNLIANALKFHRRDEPPVVKVHGEREGESVRLFVADNGIGFDEKYLDRIFTIFQRLHGREEYEGTGVGLAVCRKIAHRHGGSITARSQPGQGATFIVTLPVRQAVPDRPA